MIESDNSGNGWHRRHVLLAGVAGAGAVALAGSPAAAASPTATSAGQPWTRATSQNGWPVIGSTATRTYHVEGSNASVALLTGEVATVLLHVVRRFHYEISAVTVGAVSGHHTNRRISAPYESNYLSGTAVAIWPDRYPAGVRGGFFAHEVAVVRDILAECEGVVRWGGDHRARPKEGHFQIDVRPGDGRLLRVARKIGSWDATPGNGAGTPADIYSPGRRRAASTLATRQQS
ncbi:hypothetical protein MRQ36_16950 [Micromonospora sp. R77]|uniref:hypothetical protein n=1 Tax=Micromonospora sp. R77 TaxID=2925836 RepID=UPI001F60A1C7|nr:hypothetical protein [Micromonospora sp. R77]MCI4064195.1 hypothetical protein [Micromonospora sp. R77]